MGTHQGALVPAGLREPNKELKTLAFKQACLQLVRCHCSKRLSSPALLVAIIKRDNLELYSSDWERFPAPGSACVSQPCPGFALCRAECKVPQPVQHLRAPVCNSAASSLLHVSPPCCWVFSRLSVVAFPRQPMLFLSYSRGPAPANPVMTGSHEKSWPPA